LRKEIEESHDSVVAVGCLTEDKSGVFGTKDKHVNMNAIVLGTDPPSEARKISSPLETASVDPLR